MIVVALGVTIPEMWFSGCRRARHALDDPVVVIGVLRFEVGVVDPLECVGDVVGRDLAVHRRGELMSD